MLIRETLIILCVGGINRFPPNADLVYKGECATGDYYDQMNISDFEKWVLDKLVRNLPFPTVTVPCHYIQADKPPSAYTL
jgi:hypothetical protein